MPDLVISNTSPLFYLHILNHLHLLQNLYRQVTIPPAVVDELEAGRQQGEDVPDLGRYAWISVLPVSSPRLLGLASDFGAGETEALALALEHPNSLIILDERLARQAAALRGLRITGTAGILLKAKQRRFITEVRPLLARLIDEGFRLSDAVQNRILQLAEET